MYDILASDQKIKSKLSKSLNEDLIHSVTHGKFLTTKHALVEVVLHTMTGQKLPINILLKLGSRCSYDRVCEIKTSLAELLKLSKMRCKCRYFNLIHQWSQLFSGWIACATTLQLELYMRQYTIHNTHAVAFQEECDGSINRDKSDQLHN